MRSPVTSVALVTPFQLMRYEMRLLLESAIAALPVAYRSVFVLREVEGLTTVETAECLEVSADVVKTRLHRARLVLREALVATAGSAVAAYPFLVPRCDRVVRSVFVNLELIGMTGPSLPWVAVGVVEQGGAAVGSLGCGLESQTRASGAVHSRR